MIDTLMVLGFVIFVVLIAVAALRRPRSTILFCPRWEQMVEMKGGKCVAVDGDRFAIADSVWNCPRPCLYQAEVRASLAKGRRVG